MLFTSFCNTDTSHFPRQRCPQFTSIIILFSASIRSATQNTPEVLDGIQIRRISGPFHYMYLILQNHSHVEYATWMEALSCLVIHKMFNYTILFSTKRYHIVLLQHLLIKFDSDSYSIAQFNCFKLAQYNYVSRHLVSDTVPDREMRCNEVNCKDAGRPRL